MSVISFQFFKITVYISLWHNCATYSIPCPPQKTLHLHLNFSPPPSYHGDVHTFWQVYILYKNAKTKTFNTDAKNIWQSVVYFFCSITFKPPTSARWNGSNNGPRWVLWRGKGKQKKRKALKYPCCRQVLQSQELAPLQHTNREMFFWLSFFSFLFFLFLPFCSSRL